MELLYTPFRSTQTLEDYFSPTEMADPIMDGIFARTLGLITYLKANPPHSAVTVDRSMNILTFTTGDGAEYRRVSVIVQGPLYWLRTPLAPDQAPWPDAFISGVADTVEQAAEMITGFLFPPRCTLIIVPLLCGAARQNTFSPVQRHAPPIIAGSWCFSH